MADNATRTVKLINWQLPMQRVLYALVPMAIFAVYLYGWRALLMLAICNGAAFLSEYAFCRNYKQPVTSAVFVTGTLFAMSLPPQLPFWMAIVGIVFGVVFGKMVFGGFGKNIFNPALTGRAFIYISFGDYMTARCWTHPIDGLLGGFAAYSNRAVDAITQATPGSWLTMGADKLQTAGITPEMFTWQKLLIGNTAGCIGGTSAILVILGGLYLIYAKTANYRIVISCFAGYLVMQSILYFTGSPVAPPWLGIFGGSAFFGFFFYATDPVSACKTNEGRWLYGTFIGIMTSLITAFSVWPAGTMFAILLANMFSPITDYAINSYKKRKKS